MLVLGAAGDAALHTFDKSTGEDEYGELAGAEAALAVAADALSDPGALAGAPEEAPVTGAPPFETPFERFTMDGRRNG